MTNPEAAAWLEAQPITIQEGSRRRNSTDNPATYALSANMFGYREGNAGVIQMTLYSIKGDHVEKSGYACHLCESAREMGTLIDLDKDDEGV